MSGRFMIVHSMPCEIDQHQLEIDQNQLEKIRADHGRADRSRSEEIRGDQRRPA